MSERVITKIQDSQTNLGARCALGVAQHSSTAHLCNPSGASNSKEDSSSCGVRYCDKCGEPLEVLFPDGPILGMDRHPRMCECMRIKNFQETMERLEREHKEKISRNRSICFADKKMYEWNLKNDDRSVPAMVHARNYVDKFELMLEDNIGYLFWGGVGTGKSYMAACIANALLDKEYTVKMTNFATIINDLFCCEDKNEYIDALVKYDLLIIDDLGAERGTEYAVENVFNVIDRRYRSGKPLIITTNLHLSMLINEQSLDKKRIYDRILELCIPVCVNGASKRTATAKEKMKEMQEIAKSYQKGGDAIE